MQLLLNNSTPSSATVAVAATVATLMLSMGVVAMKSKNKQPTASELADARAKSIAAIKLPQGAVTGSFTNARNQTIHTVRMEPPPPPPPKPTSPTRRSLRLFGSPKQEEAQAEEVPPSGTVFFFHGLNDHSGRPGYVRLYERLLAQNCRVLTMDHHGHGQSDGERAFCNSIEDYVDDCCQFIQESTTDGNLILVGHSMGGLIALLASKRLGDKVTALGMTSPALGVVMDLEKKIQKFISPLIDVTIPHAKIVDGVRPVDMSRNPIEVQNIIDDALITKGNVKARTGIQLAYTFDKLLVPGFCQQLQLPILLCHGTGDKCTEIQASLATFQRFGTPKEQKLFVRLPGLYHELYNEVERDSVLEAMTEFCASGGTKFPTSFDVGEDRVMDMELI